MLEPPHLETLRGSVVHALEAAVDPRLAAELRLFHKYDDFVAYGMTAPVLRRVLGKFRAPFKRLSLPERLELAGALFQAGIAEQANAAILLLSLSTAELGPGHLETLDRFLDDFHSWGKTDDFCINVLQPLLWQHPQPVLALPEKWNRSGNRWKRRASVVAFTRKARVLEFVKDLRRRGVPAAITLYAIRDLKGEERRAVLEIHAKGREG
jgi:hypothetical protein